MAVPSPERVEQGSPGIAVSGPSAAPSTIARLLAVAAIVFAGASGGLIGYAVVDLGCQHGCKVAAGISGLVVAGLTAGGVAIVAVLTLRAMGEWQRSGRRPK